MDKVFFFKWVEIEIIFIIFHTDDEIERKIREYIKLSRKFKLNINLYSLKNLDLIINSSIASFKT